MKKNVNEIKKELENREMSFVELDAYMEENGYYSVLDDGTVNDIKADKQVVYTACDTNECEVVISFDITVDCGEDDDASDFYMTISEVREY